MVDAFNMTVARSYEGMVLTNVSSGSDNLGNAQTDQPGERFTIGGIRVDLGSTQFVNQVALLYTNCLPGETLVVYTSTGPSDQAPVLIGAYALEAAAGGSDPNYRHLLGFFPGVVTRYLNLYVQQGPAVVTRTAGRLVVANALQVEFNPDYGATSWGYEEAPEPDTLDSGVTILEELPAAPYFEFQITWASEQEMEEWNRRFAPLQWKRRPLLVVRRPDAHAYRHSGIFWGILRLQPFVAAEFDLFEVTGKIRSMV